MKLLSHLFPAILAVLIVGFGGALIFEPPPVTVYQRTVLTPFVHVGGSFAFRSVTSVDKQCEAQIFREIIDASGTVISSTSEFRPEFTQEPNVRVQRVVVLPVTTFATPGKAIYKFHSVWQCNFLQRIFPLSVVKTSLAFEILP